MRRVIAAFSTVAVLIGATAPVEAESLGQHLKHLLARGRHAVQSLEKRYTKDFLTVPQLAECIKRAKNLDQERDRLEEFSSTASASPSQAVPSGNASQNRDEFNKALEIHNQKIKVYNADCEKEYYADDLAAAQKLAASE